MNKKPKPRNPEYETKVREIFYRANFINLLEIQIGDVEPGLLTSYVDIKDKHLQQNGYVHAGVISTLADHTAGGAAATLVGKEQIILTLEFKINLLRPGIGNRLRCNAKVFYQGATVIVVDSEVYADHKQREKLVAKATVTLAVMGNRYGGD
ncbi:PaaI family thioesterase [Leptospira gomenensis]|uniref:Medium/long-chain acyl-CoA thioesterase YigI n=1 Tax=Leptospira gomenensis TaxID=2484974 RepID=A0A5F1YDD9_9LEPT|nr:PaaI family thioesterase [Leptospira gomenensis]TGK36067.1 PaaI family thioesterase [Leptospira gomenensis]TGK41813.1 PaaI family thioesterase [Leptospira gomenensis]TGK53330.1 PaaI family thioesterase [Leptospira gomenensis]TGK64936.1 PaaI family thioesterase [Leptospira gomenensis]